MTKRLSSITIFILVIGVGSAFAHEHKVMGTVTMAATDHLMIKTTDDKEATVKIVADTKVTRGKETVKPESIKEGTRVVVTTASDTAPYTAIAIEVGPDPKPTKKRPASAAEPAAHARTRDTAWIALRPSPNFAMLSR